MISQKKLEGKNSGSRETLTGLDIIKKTKNTINFEKFQPKYLARKINFGKY